MQSFLQFNGLYFSMKRFNFAMALLLTCVWLQGQDFEPYQDYNAAPERIKSIQFNIAGYPLSMPVAKLDNSAPLELRFDDLYAGVSNFVYTIVHCDRNWIATDLDRSYFTDSFDQLPIREYQFSVTARSSYTHYVLRLPNEDLNWKLSGNYALLVFDEDEDDEEPIFVRRFMVLDEKAKIDIRWTKAVGPDAFNTAQEIDMSLIPNKGVRIQRPQMELSATILQNFRWDQALSNIVPTLEMRDEILFDYQGKLIFPAGKEFRMLDLRWLDVPRGQIQKIELESDQIIAFLQPDEARTYKNYDFQFDINGRYLITNNNLFTNFGQDELQNNDLAQRNAQIRGEYIRCVFALIYAQELENQDVYIVGAFNDWQLSEENKMEYNEAHKAYTKVLELKQGIYNYMYTAVPHHDQITAEDIEGNWFETDNSYTVLMYYRPFGERYDQLIAVEGFSSLRN